MAFEKHSFSIPATTWTITHHLKKYPTVFVYDTAGDSIWTDVQYMGLTTVIVTFQNPTAGYVFLH